MRLVTVTLVLGLAAGCSQPNGNGEAKPGASSGAAATPKLGIRPYGDETVKPDLARVPEDLKKASRNRRRW
jgi:hypothetical protein